MDRDNEIKRNDKKERGIQMNEDVTKYGEWVPSYFAWVSLDEQKEKAIELNETTKNENNRKNEK